MISSLDLFCLKPPSRAMKTEPRCFELQTVCAASTDCQGWMGQKCVFFRKLKVFKVSIWISMAHLFLTEFIEILHVPKMSLQRDLRLRSIQAEGLWSTDCQRARWARSFLQVHPGLLYFFGGLSTRQLENF